MNGSVAGGGYAEEIISLTRRPSGKAGAVSPRRGSRAEARAAPGEAGAEARGGGGRRDGRGGHRGGAGRVPAARTERSAQRGRAQGPLPGNGRGGYVREKLVPCVRESWLGQGPSSAAAPVEAGVPADNSPLVFPGSCHLRWSCCFQARRQPLSAQPRWIP